MQKRFFALGAVSLIAALSVAPQAQAQTASGCLVTQASQAALQRRLAEIDGLKTNVNSFFSGAGACITNGLLNNFDMSSLIPDPSGLMSSGIQTLARQAIDAAKQQACTIVQNGIQNAVGRLNTELDQYTSGSGSKISAILGSNAAVTIPNIAGFGSYTFTTPTIQDVASATAATVSQSAGVSSGVSSAASGISSAIRSAPSSGGTTYNATSSGMY